MRGSAFVFCRRNQSTLKIDRMKSEKPVSGCRKPAFGMYDLEYARQKDPGASIWRNSTFAVRNSEFRGQHIVVISV